MVEEEEDESEDEEEDDQDSSPDHDEQSDSEPPPPRKGHRKRKATDAVSSKPKKPRQDASVQSGVRAAARSSERKKVQTTPQPVPTKKKLGTPTRTQPQSKHPKSTLKPANKGMMGLYLILFI